MQGWAASLTLRWHMWIPASCRSCRNTESTINTHGRKLVRQCAYSAMILCTGGTLADTPARPTFKARTNTVASRLDHVLVDPDHFFSFTKDCGVGPTRPDMPLEMRILLSAAAPPSPVPSNLHLCGSTPQHGFGVELTGSSMPLPYKWGHAKPVCNRALRLLLLGICRWSLALKTAAQMAGLRKIRPQSSRPPTLSKFPCCAQVSIAACQVAVSMQSRGRTLHRWYWGSSGAARHLAISRMSCLCPSYSRAIFASFGARSACHTACSPQSYRHPQPGVGTLPI